MRQVMAFGALALGLAVAFVGIGCCCSQPAPVEPAETFQEPPPPVASPAPRPEPVVIPPPPPPPAPAPAPMPPAVVKAIEDLNQKYPGLFTFDKDKGLLTFNTDVTFDSGSSVVKPDAKAALGKLAEILSKDEAKDRRLIIVGHTDSDRVVKAATIAHLKALHKSTDNMGLSEARAEAVGAVLKAGGIDAARMEMQAKGDTQPVASNSTPAGKARNRRVEIYLTPMTAAAPAN